MFRYLALASLSTLLATATVSAAECPRVVKDYETSRQIFKKLAAEVAANPKYGTPDHRPNLDPLKVEYQGTAGEDLTMDVLTIPARKEKTLVVQINSGIHALEAPTGSYMQQHFLMRCLPEMTDEMLDHTTFVVTHALNPWGFKHASRFNANNVDLNRNCGGARPDGEEFSLCCGGRQNDEYGMVKWVFHRLIHQPKPITPLSCRIELSLAALAYGNLHPQRFMERALAGQVEDPKGIYYAGDTLEPECKAYQTFSERFYEGEGAHQNSLTITWHTGYGDLGHLQYMGNPQDLKNARLTGVLEQHMGKKDDMTTLDFCPSFETCNDENVWLRNVHPDRQPNEASTNLNGYLTAEIGGLGGIQSICAVLMSEQITGERSKPLFEGGSDKEKKFKEQIFEVFNPTDDASYMKALEHHAVNSCNAIKGYIGAVLQSKAGDEKDEKNAPGQCPKP